MATETTLKCAVCGKELEYSGRGRPPTRCADHKTTKLEDKKVEQKQETEKTEGEVKSETPPPRPRPRPGQKPEEKKTEAEPPKLAPIGASDTQSRTKAEQAEKRTVTEREMADTDSWPRDPRGLPMAKIEMSASELVPTAQYANVSIGPARITAFVDLSRNANGEGYFSEGERSTLVKALNELAEVVERDVIAVQRMLVMESMSDQLNKG